MGRCVMGFRVHNWLTVSNASFVSAHSVTDQAVADDLWPEGAVLSRGQ